MVHVREKRKRSFILVSKIIHNLYGSKLEISVERCTLCQVKLHHFPFAEESASFAFAFAFKTHLRRDMSRMEKYIKRAA